MSKSGPPNRGLSVPPDTATHRRSIIAGLILAVCLHACGYRLSGRSVALPEGVKAVGIPTFINQTNRPDLEQRITEQVTQEFSTRGRIRILANEEGADAVLLGTILTYMTNPVVISEQGRASRYEIRITASVVLRETKTDRLLWEDDHFLFRRQYDVPATTAAFVDQEIVAIDEVARDFARSVVSSILEGF
ncbi:MAG: LptE family protein [Acidobacteria bacterium]|nr:LptE family protein [Acidobacteriota bacterium]